MVNGDVRGEMREKAIESLCLQAWENGGRDTPPTSLGSAIPSSSQINSDSRVKAAPTKQWDHRYLTTRHTTFQSPPRLLGLGRGMEDYCMQSTQSWRSLYRGWIL
jgi:hypothetical protein